MLSLPYAFAKSGVILGLVLLFLTSAASQVQHASTTLYLLAAADATLYNSFNTV
jgi:amino acid permease